ncbi:MAG: DUF2961 domain-containing protein [Fulvivirga sp.]
MSHISHLKWQWWIIGLMILSLQVNAQHKNANDLPVIPIGMDAYRMWDKLPIQRIGARAYMRSTYDREGKNQSADASHYLFANEEDYNVSLDVKGKGVFYFFRANHWHGSPWHFIVDGEDNVVKETGTGDPVNAKRVFDKTSFIPEKPFPEPIAWTWGTTNGADLIWRPMPFEESFRIAYSRTRYGTGYYIYHLYANEDNLSQPIETFDMSTAPDPEVVELISRAGTDIAPKNIKKKTGKIKLNQEKMLLANIKAAPSSIRAFKLSLPMEKAIALERLRLLVTWDGAEHPSIDAPLCLFFGAGTLYNREEDEYLVQGFPINIRYDYDNQEVELACYYPMPFFKSAKFEIAGIAPDDIEIEFEIRYEKYNTPINHSSYFHATYTDIPEPELGKDMTFLDTKGIEGHEEWSGNFVGTSFIFSHNAFLGTLEGDPRFYFDDSQTPQAYGTGTEEWGGGGDYWGGRNMTLPFAGHPCGAPNKKEAKNDKDLIQSAYRFLISDLMPFGRRAVIGFEHGGENLSSEHYEAITYWYGLPAPSLVKTDAIDIGKAESEKEHKYYSPDASAVVSITSRYERGIDFFPYNTWGMDRNKIPGYQEKIGTEVYPAHEEEGRYTRSISEFTVKLDPENVGLLLRRTLDYSFPNQTAEIYIADASEGDPDDDAAWEYAGIWYLAGANTALYSDPGGELEKRLHRTKTTNRRFRDDEFLVSSKLSANRSAIRVRVKFVPNAQQLFPDFPFPKESAWSELRYDVYSYVMPDFKVK